MKTLHPDLRSCVQAGVLHHPLLGQRRYSANFNEIYNREYDRKLLLLEQAKTLKNWTQAILLHDRPFRPLALQRFSTMMDDDVYWRLVAEIWIDAEDVQREQLRWTQIWSSRRPCRDQVMTLTEHRVLARIKDNPVTIYRGCSHADLINGLSWSFNEAVSRQAIRVTATVPKECIQAFFHRRRPGRPAEVIVLTKDYTVTSVTERRARSRPANRQVSDTSAALSR